MLRRLLTGGRARTALLAVGAVAVIAALLQAYPRPPAPRPLPAVTPAATRTPTAAAAGQPARSTSPSATATPRPRPPSGPVDLNTATKDELLALPGIGEVRAQRILDSRASDGPFHDPTDLVARKIVPQGVFNQIKDRVTAE